MAFRRPLILGIETSCDDTAGALLDGDGRVLASVVSSQLAHKPYGGVVPEIASREHLRNWPAVSAAVFGTAGLGVEDIDAVAATRGPGLVGALLVGLSLGKGLAYGLGREFHGVHHMEAHLFSPFVRTGGELAEEPPERFIGLVVSGGHTLLLGVERGVERRPGGERLTTLAETRDDAIGEAFDKLGKRLGLPYPQGPRVDELAERGDAERCRLPVAARSDDLFFSYSGLKSQTLLELEKLARRGIDIAPRADPDGGLSFVPEVLDLLAGFRAAAVAQLIDRLARLHRRQPIEMLAVSGGVAANRLLRREVSRWSEAEGVALRLVPMAFCGDNAAMIAWRALLKHRSGASDDPRRTEAASRLPFAR